MLQRTVSPNHPLPGTLSESATVRPATVGSRRVNHRRPHVPPCPAGSCRTGLRAAQARAATTIPAPARTAGGSGATSAPAMRRAASTPAVPSKAARTARRAACGAASTHRPDPTAIAAAARAGQSRRRLGTVFCTACEGDGPGRARQSAGAILMGQACGSYLQQFAKVATTRKRRRPRRRRRRLLPIRRPGAYSPK